MCTGLIQWHELVPWKTIKRMDRLYCNLNKHNWCKMESVWIEFFVIIWEILLKVFAICMKPDFLYLLSKKPFFVFCTFCLEKVNSKGFLYRIRNRIFELQKFFRTFIHLNGNYDFCEKKCFKTLLCSTCYESLQYSLQMARTGQIACGRAEETSRRLAASFSLPHSFASCAKSSERCSDIQFSPFFYSYHRTEYLYNNILLTRK